MDFHTYQKRSVLFNLFCDHKLVDVYPRKAFLPWEYNLNISTKTKYVSNDKDKYFMLF